MSHEDDAPKILTTSGSELLHTEVLACLDTIDNEITITRLEQQAWLTDVPRVRLLSYERQQREGAYPYYVRGFEQETIDDYTLLEPALLLGAYSDITTMDGKLIVLRARALSTPSDLFHVVFARTDDYDYLYHVLRHIDPSGLVQRTSSLDTISLDDLKSFVIPWMTAEARKQFIEVMEKLDFLYGAYRNEPGARNIRELRDLLASYLCGFSRLPSLLTELVETENIDRDRCEKQRIFPHVATTTHEVSAPSSDSHGEVFDLIEGILDTMKLKSSRSSLFDVIAATSDLSAGSIGLKGQTVVCFPPPGQSAWTSSIDEHDSRWILGPPPSDRADYAWIQQTIDCMEDEAVALMLLSNSALHSTLDTEEPLRKKLAMSGLVQCVISLPGGVFPDQRLPSSIVILQKGRVSTDILFINAQETGKALPQRTHGNDSDNANNPPEGYYVERRYLPKNAISRIAGIYRLWFMTLGEEPNDLLCRLVPMSVIRGSGYLLTPWTYIRS